MDTLFLVDGTGYIFRAYHAIKPMRNAAGQPIHAVLGFTRMLLKLIKEHQPRSMAVVFDAGRNTFRLQLYPEYKANRDTPPDDLKAQIPMCVEAVDALGLKRLQVEGVEADDVLATLALKAAAAGQDVRLVTGDKDLMQLVDGRIRILRYSQRNETEELVDEEGVRKHFGVPPSQVVDVLALMGDTSDNVPGVDGIGEKTATELIQQFGSVEGVLAAAPSMKPGKRKDTLLAQADRARLSRQLVTLHTSVELPFGPQDAAFSTVNVAAARAFFARMGFKALLNDPMFAGAPAASAPSVPSAPSAQGQLALDGPAVSPAVDAAAPPVPAPDVPTAGPVSFSAMPREGHRMLRTVEDLRALLPTLDAAPLVSLDVLTTEGGAMRGHLQALGLSWGAGQAACMAVAGAGGLLGAGLPVAQLREELGTRLSAWAPKLTGHDLKERSKALMQHGFGAVRAQHDVELASYVLARSEIHDLQYVAQRHLKVTVPTLAGLLGKGRSALKVEGLGPDALVDLLCSRADAALQATVKVEEALRTDGLWDLYANLEMPLSHVLLDMERAGVGVDVPTLKDISQEVGVECRRLEEECVALAGGAFNLGSPKQLAEVLFEKLGLPVRRKTKTGPSTDQDVLEALAELHPLPMKILEHRHLHKLQNTYLDALPAIINPATGRIHTTYQQAVAATGRLSSTDPNLQNIPIRDERGRRIRSAFRAPPGCVLISADYSQIELRILAHVSEDPVLLNAFETGEDVHTRTASEVLGIPVSEVTKDQRRAAKTINFGLLYGMSAFGLSQALRIPRAQAKEYLERYYARLTGISAWQQNTIEEARAHGQVTTMFGRRRLLPDLAQRNYAARQGAERMAINTPIQGAAADIIKRAMLRVDARLRRDHPQARMILQVHDELVLEAPTAEANAVQALLREEMGAAASLRVKLDVETGAGPDWGAAHG